MHRPLWNFSYPFRSHALVHHHIFKSDHTCHLVEPERDKKKIWSSLVERPGDRLAWSTRGYHTGRNAAVRPLGHRPLAHAAFGSKLYWQAPRMHATGCMHLPKARRVERSWVDLYRLNGHHLLHHRYMHKNFNVVMPFAGCFARRSCCARKSDAAGQPPGTGRARRPTRR